MTTKTHGFIDTTALEQQARAARANHTREAFAALAAAFVQLTKALRPARPLTGNGQPRAFA